MDLRSAALIVVDLQPDFMPGGALPVVEGHLVVEPIARLVRSGKFRSIVATQDWHPPGHVSFASTHPGRAAFETIELYGRPQTLWPDHCVQGSAGAEIHPSLTTEAVAAIIRKGSDPMCDSYSGFRNNWNALGERPPTGLAGFLKELSISEVFLCGLARDFCVKWSAQDAVEAGFCSRVVWDLTRPVDAASDVSVRDELIASGVGIVTSSQLDS